MILDSNILLYAHVEDLKEHSKVKAWLGRKLSDGSEVIGVPWQVATAFIRISTSTRIFRTPFDIAFAKECLDRLFSHPLVQAASATDDHWKRYSRLLVELNLSGDIVIDAHIAAIAIEHNASVASSDKDFRRFSDYVKIIDPLAL